MTTNPLTVTAPEGVPFIEFEREFDAPVAAVFRAHTRPRPDQAVARPARLRDEDRALRLPHRRRLPLHPHATPTASEYAFNGVFHTVRAERVRHPDVRVRGLPRRRQHRVDDVRGPRRRPHAARGHSVYPTVESRDGMVASDMELGMPEGYERLDALVAA